MVAVKDYQSSARFQEVQSLRQSVQRLCQSAESAPLYVEMMGGADKIASQDWLGHRSIQHTTRYTQLSAAPFKDFWSRG
jgi:hypothetical protein